MCSQSRVSSPAIAVMLLICLLQQYGIYGRSSIGAKRPVLINP